MTHRIWLMPCGEASTVATAMIAPLRVMSTEDCPFTCIHERVTSAQKCEAKLAMNFATRSRPNTGTRATPVSPPPSLIETTFSAKISLRALRVSFLRRGEEGLKKAAMFGGAYLCSPLIDNVFAGAGNQLAGIRLGELKDVRDIAMGIVESLAKNVGGTLIGREIFEQEKNRQLQCFTTFCSEGRVGSGVYGLREPGANICLALRTRGLGETDCQPHRRRYKKCCRVPHHTAVGGLPAQPDLLHNVLRFGRSSEDAVGDAEEPWAHAEKGGRCALECDDIV